MLNNRKSAISCTVLACLALGMAAVQAQESTVQASPPAQPAPPAQPPAASQTPSGSPAAPTIPQPLAITDAVQLALTRNAVVLQSRDLVNAARARISSARSAEFPSVTASVDYRRLSSPGSFTIPSTPPREVAIGTAQTTTGAISLRQDIYTGGRVQAIISQQEAQYDVAIGQLGTTEAQVALQARQAYYNVLLAQALVVSAQKTLDSACAQLNEATARFEAGTAARFDVLRAQTQVSEAQQNLVSAQNQVQNARVALNRILGIPQDTTIALVEPGLAPGTQEPLQTLVDTARRERPEILSARAQVAAANAGIRIARSQSLPNLSVTATYQGVTPNDPTQPSGLTIDALASIVLFNGGKTRADVAAARSERSAAAANLSDVTQGVEQDVRQSYLNLQNARQTIDTARTLLAQAEEAYSVATVRYQAGVGTAVELADALATLTSARTNLDQATYNYSIAFATLQRSIGRVVY